MAENNVKQSTETSVNNTPNDASNIESKQDNTTSDVTVDGSSSKPANKFSGQSRLCLGGRFTPGNHVLNYIYYFANVWCF